MMNTNTTPPPASVEAVVLQLATNRAPLRVAFYAWAKFNRLALKDLTARLGVSYPSTISTALSGTGRPELRSRIEKLIGYRERANGDE
jgi:hypothetical protein